MSREQKLALVGLAVFALLCVVVLTWGQFQPGCTGVKADCAPDWQPGAGMQALGGLLSVASPPVKLPLKRYQFNSKGPLEVEIPPAETEMRPLKLRRVQGMIELRLVAPQVPGKLELPKDQDEVTTLPRDAENPDDRIRLAFAVPAAGARLYMACVSAPCVLEVD